MSSVGICKGDSAGIKCYHDHLIMFDKYEYCNVSMFNIYCYECLIMPENVPVNVHFISQGIGSRRHMWMIIFGTQGLLYKCRFVLHLYNWSISMVWSISMTGSLPSNMEKSWKIRVGNYYDERYKKCLRTSMNELHSGTFHPLAECDADCTSNKLREGKMVMDLCS